MAQIALLPGDWPRNFLEHGMNKRYAQAAQVAFEPLEDMEFEIEGLESLGDGRFRMTGVRPVRIDMATVSLVLEQAGIDKRDVHRYTEQFAEDVYQGEIAKVFAQRAKRVG